MKKLLTLTDEDIFSSEILETFEKPDAYENRVAVKVLIFNDDEIALVGTTGFLFLPGGAVEEGETLEEAGVGKRLRRLDVVSGI